MSRTFWVARIRTLNEFAGYLEHIGNVYEEREKIERSITPSNGTGWNIDGYCGVCRRETKFWVDHAYAFQQPDGTSIPNFRERLTCEYCQLNTRMRGVVQFIEDIANISTTDDVYVTEMLTPLFKALRSRFCNVIGSEFLPDGTPLGLTNSDGIRNEDVTRLTFESEKFNCLISLDVIEHVPDHMLALAEAARCLKRGGKLILTVPFAFWCSTHIERARVVNGQIEHMMKPEYHGDPLSQKGILCYRHYGWSLLDELSAVGFAAAEINLYWSRELGYIGGWPFVILATKAV